ncbi:uncharacterized protein BO95DRAFT_484155 [Aspergillus brunneoviolaceus CBS 621.78]|uniref:Uncharacterized protein n=1 Tax=Aspergillus brunneoviolaceus CBS 621.78 TaxID=1450534 RepID=A0ACD1G260_9EURO|nr:hypothetical protein BO95DRAFT_484155 [Aspergillus brunneoviolaceus CBS 621.78]RAH43298.1 hypothetical protein BO95DRAFT_484155 [Aspergillus brunneoviolaceus CBS 621.78]
MAKSPRGNKQRAAVAAAGSDEKAASSSFLAELDHALESRPVSWLQAVESLSQNPSTEPPGHGITKSIEQTTIHHNTDQKDNNTAGCDESNTAYDNDISDFESSGATRLMESVGQPTGSQEDVSVDRRSRTEAIDLLRARTATRSTPTSSPTPTQTPSTPVVTVVDTTPANAVDSSHLPPTSSSTENPAFEQSASLSVASSPKALPSEQPATSPLSPGSEDKPSDHILSPSVSSSPKEQPSAEPLSSLAPEASVGISSEQPVSSPAISSQDKDCEEPLDVSAPITSESKSSEAPVATARPSTPENKHSSLPARASPCKVQTSEQILSSPIPSVSEDEPSEQSLSPPVFSSSDDKPSQQPLSLPVPSKTEDKPVGSTTPSPPKDTSSEKPLSPSIPPKPEGKSCEQSISSTTPLPPKETTSGKPSSSPLPSRSEEKPSDSNDPWTSEDKPPEHPQPQIPPLPASSSLLTRPSEPEQSPSQDHSPQQPQPTAPTPKMEPTKSSKKAKKNKAKKNRKKANRAAAGGSGSGSGGGGRAGTGAAESSNLSTSGQSEVSNATTALTKSVNEHELSAKEAETNKDSSNNGSSSSSRHEAKAPATWNKLPELASNTSRINKSDIKLSAAVAAAAAAIAQSRGSRNLRVHPDTTAAASQDQGDRIHDPETAAKIVAIQAAIDRLQAIQQNPSEFVEPIEGLLRIETPPGQSCPSPLLASAKIANITVAPCRGRPGAARSEVPTKTDGEESTLTKGSGKETDSPPPYSRDPAPTTPQSNTVTTRTGLTPIQEATAEGQQEGKAGQGDTHKSGTQKAREGGDAHDLTPKSTSTTSTAWTASQHALQTTPQTAVTSEPSTTKTTGTQPKARGNNTTTTTQSSAKRPTLPLPPPATHPQVASSSHAHPSPPPPTTVTSTSRAPLSPTASTTSTSTSTTHYQQIANVRGGTLSSQKPEGFFWQLDSHGFPCALRNCPKRCNSWDGVTVICPGCGPFSETRYCCRDHLLQGIKTHWPVCGDHVFVHPCRESTIPRDVREGPPLIPCLHNYDMPERHRQAVYFRMNERQGDYFIFADWADYVRAGFPENTTAVRCAKRVVYTVRFEDPEEKDRFRRVLAICLFATVEVHALIDYMYRLIRDQLRAANASKQLEAALRYQIHAETNVSIQQYITGERHACATDWDGRNRRNCPDQVCRSEYRRLLGSLGGGGLREVVRNMESTYWILRAARTTHPTVKDPKKRMLGEGFEGVAEEDQRVFRRGDGWDGAGTGNMEIEGMNEGPEEA